MGAPTAADMEAAKILVVQLEMDFAQNPAIRNVGDLGCILGDGGATTPWVMVEGLRHKYFLYDEASEICSGVYVFSSQEALDNYLVSRLFREQTQYRHVRKGTYAIKDVMPGTELAMEHTDWAHRPPRRRDVSQACMLIVDLTMDYTTGIEGLPRSAEELYHLMSEEGGGYPRKFLGVPGLCGKYFAYDHGNDHCYGFFAFVNRESLERHLASDLFKTQGDAPHIASVSHTVHQVLPGTERTMGMGVWAGQAASRRR